MSVGQHRLTHSRPRSSENQAAGGECQISGASERGTSVVVRIPYPRARQAG